ncbi:sulfurtransferase [Hydrogenophaga sp. 5NK40-0174]|uniref:sulfurtransferase n=1 Tax=Hydrogenophaga sp. 5NK40-0174 TaxID=3127649 RepID=UPI0031021F87
MFSTLIAPQQLASLLDQSRTVHLFDCSYDLAAPGAGREQYLDSHIPGAQYADLHDDLSASTGAAAASGGRHPLPDRAAFAMWLAQKGVRAGEQVVVYDRQNSAFGPRLWWMSKWCGHEACAVLDGGLAGWLAQGGALASGPTEEAPRGDFTLSAPLAALHTLEKVKSGLGTAGQKLLDARAEARFSGLTEPLDPVAGHIPGARNRPFGDNLQPDGHFKPAAQLREEFLAALGYQVRHAPTHEIACPQGVVHYCGSGVTAAVNLLAMEVAGLGRQSLFAGSWSEWSRQPETAKARGIRAT